MWVISMELKEIRVKNNMTQSEAAKALGVSLRSYKSYENEIEKKSTRKYYYLCETLMKFNQVDENHGILSIDCIREGVQKIFSNYDIKFCYLFGSYAKGYAKDDSDIDLLIDTEITGLDFFGLVEELRVELNKKVDLLRLKDISSNLELLKEILKDGVKIYG